MGIEDVGRIVDTDVLVIGCGIAGAFAAIKAKAAGAEVTVVDRAVVGRSGASCLASGVFHHFDPAEDNIEDALKEGCLATVYLMDQKVSRKALLQTYQSLQEMDKWGVKWEKRDGTLVRVRGHGSISTRTAVLSGSGRQLMLALGNEVRRRGVRVVNRVMITELLTSDGRLPTSGRVVGAVGFNTQNGDIYLFRSKATILCAGGWKLPYAEHVPYYQGGDGHAMAIRVGAELNGLDRPAVRGVHPIHASIGSTINIVMGQGAIMTNRLGKRYMEKLDPVRKEQTERWLLNAATLNELREGRGPIGLDMTHFTPEQFRLVRTAIPLVIANLEAAGKDITRDKIEYIVWTYPHLVGEAGGARINDKGETSIPGLYAAGDNSDNAGACIVALPAGSVMGSWAGENAAKYASTVEMPKIAEEQAKQMKGFMVAPLTKDGVSFGDIWAKAERIARDGIGLIMHEERLKKAIEEIKKIKAEDIPRLAAENPHELAKVHTLCSFLEVSEVICLASILRKETRRASLREDFPETDNINWLKWINVKKEDGEIKIRYEPLPIEEYPYPPPRERFDQLHLFSDTSTEEDILGKAVKLS
ncbi:MAG: FAD-dependent oxidoreductase [Chloroflexi bacterium]|nr:FAD-dependent oxidoreductase [Chloroflexota bacterium]